MPRVTRFACVTLILLSTVALAGTGTAAAQDPVEISNAQELQNISDDLDGDYVLTDDIDASGFDFEAIGGRGSPFTGTLDGNGHTISGLTADGPDAEGARLQDLVGLFGVIGENGTVEGVGIEEAKVVGVQDVGGLAGINNGEISRSYVDARVGGFSAVGGLVGNNKGEISRSYSTGEVNATGNDVGGIVGSNKGNVTESYAGTILTVEPDSTATGGAVGIDAGRTTHVYWDTNVSGTAESHAGTGLTTGEMTGDRAKQSMEGFDFNGTWRTTEGYPVLAWQPEGTDNSPPEKKPNDGGGGNGDGDDDGGTDDEPNEDGGNGNDGTDGTNGAGGGEGLPGFGALAALAALAALVGGAVLWKRAQ